MKAHYIKSEYKELIDSLTSLSNRYEPVVEALQQKYNDIRLAYQQKGFLTKLFTTEPFTLYDSEYYNWNLYNTLSDAKRVVLDIRIIKKKIIAARDSGASSISLDNAELDNIQLALFDINKYNE